MFINTLEFSNNFDKDFKSFRQMLSRILIKHPKNKKSIFEELQKHLLLPDKCIFSATMQQLFQYINRCIERMNKSLPDAIDAQYAKLQAIYSMDSATTSQQQKLEFMNHIIEVIHHFPEKNYTECYQLARSAQSPKFVSYLDRHSLNFFTQHRFKNFLRNLLHEEPNYDQPPALHQPTSISLDFSINS